VVTPAALSPRLGGGGDEGGNGGHVARLKRGPGGRASLEVVAGSAEGRLRLATSDGEAGAVAKDASSLPQGSTGAGASSRWGGRRRALAVRRQAIPGGCRDEFGRGGSGGAPGDGVCLGVLVAPIASVVLTLALATTEASSRRRGPLAKDEALEQTVAGQAVGAVQSSMRDLSACEKASEGGAGVEISRDTTAKVVLCGADGHGAPGEVAARGTQNGPPHRGEVPLDVSDTPVAYVEPHTRCARPDHLGMDAPGDGITRRQLGAWRVGEKAPPGVVKEDSSLAPHRLGHQ